MLEFLFLVWTIYSGKQRGVATKQGSEQDLGFHPRAESLKCSNVQAILDNHWPCFFFNITFEQGTHWSWRHWECPTKCREMVCLIFSSLWRSCSQQSNLYFLIILSFLGNMEYRKRWRTRPNWSPEPILLSGHTVSPHCPFLCYVSEFWPMESKWYALFLGWTHKPCQSLISSALSPFTSLSQP